MLLKSAQITMGFFFWLNNEKVHLRNYAGTCTSILTDPSIRRGIYIYTKPVVYIRILKYYIFFSFSKKVSLHPFICHRADVHHSLHINHQSVAPFSPPPALNLFTFLSFPFLYRESRLIRRSLGLIFIKGSRERELGGLVITIIFHI